MKRKTDRQWTLGPIVQLLAAMHNAAMCLQLMSFRALYYIHRMWESYDQCRGN